MMRWIIGSSLKGRLIVSAAAVLVIVFGLTQLTKMPVDALPEFARPYVEIQTEALGLSAQEVEAFITTPMEADMINGTPWAEEIRSVTIPGMSSIILTFKRGTDIMQARQVVHERMTQLFVLPQVSKPPVMVNPVSSTSRVMEVGMSSDQLSLIDLSVLARWTVAPQLMGLPGVANVSIWGERQRQLQVQVDPAKLVAENVTLQQVIKTAGNSLWASPLSYLEASTPGTGGWIETPNQRLGVRHILPINTAEDLANVPIEGAPTKRLADVATLIEDHQPLIGDALVEDEPSLILVIEKFPWANTRDVTAQIDAELATLSYGLEGVNLDATLFRPATFLQSALDNLSTTLLISSILLAVGLFAFFFNWRTALISIVSILASASVTGVVFYMRGVELNLIILAGIMIAMVAFIDDAIVGVDQIIRRIRESRKKDHGESTAYIIREAVLEMGRPLLFAGAIMVLSVTPLLFVQGLSGEFWIPLATTFILALVASYAVAMIVTPAMSFLMLRGENSLPAADSPVAGIFRGLYNSLFGWATRVPKTAFIAVCVVATVGLLSAFLLRQESILPEFKESDLVVNMEASPGTSHPAMTRIANQAGQDLRGIPGVRNVSAHIGRAIMSDRHTNINAGELMVSIEPMADYEATLARVREVVAGYPDSLNAEVLTYTDQQLRKELSGTGESLVVRVYGENTNTIIDKAEEVQRMLASIDGIVEPQVQYPKEVPTLEIEVDVERAREYGLKPGDVRRAAATLVSGLVVGQLFEDQKVFDVVVWGAQDVRSSIDDVRNLAIDLPNGGQVALANVADVRIMPSADTIHRDAVARSVDVVAQVSGRGYAAVADQIEDGIDNITFPLEYRAELLGVYAESLAARDRVITFAIAALIIIFLLIQAFVGSWRLASLLFVTLPMALAGGAVASFITAGGLVTMGSLIGFIAVFGLAIRNSITLIGRFRQLEGQGGLTGEALVQRVMEERSGPILSTAVGLALFFLPIALAGSIAGLEIAQPIAVVLVGGLITATPYTLFGIPAMYLLFGKTEAEDIQFGDELIETSLSTSVTESA